MREKNTNTTANKHIFKIIITDEQHNEQRNSYLVKMFGTDFIHKQWPNYNLLRRLFVALLSKLLPNTMHNLAEHFIMQANPGLHIKHNSVYKHVIQGV